jgi:hypothetical protein
MTMRESRLSMLVPAVGLMTDAPATEHLSQVIAHAMSPAFLLGAVAAFVALLMGRMNGIIDRMRTINAIPDNDTARVYLKSDLPRLQRRAKLVNQAIYFAVGSAISTTLLLITAFAAAFFGVRHEPGIGMLFLLALVLMCAALVTLAREVRIALSGFDHHA